MNVDDELFPCKAELSAVLIRNDGTHEDLGVVSTAEVLVGASRSEASELRDAPTGRGLKASLARLLWRILHDERGLVTNAGVNYMATDFASGLASPRVGAFNQHDSGTGTTAAAVTDTALQTPTGLARVAGVQSNPSANVYQTVATITYNATFAVTEWGLFSAAAAGTLWDHRVFAAINVVNGNSIQFTYAVTFPSGGT